MLTQNERGEWVDAKPLRKPMHWKWAQRIVDWFYRNRVRYRIESLEADQPKDAP